MRGEDEWMADLLFYIPFYSISVISGRCLDDDVRLCAVESCLRLERLQLQAGMELGTARSVGQR